MSGGSRPQYTFGATPLAAERLLLVARVFEASSRAFLHDAVPAPQLAPGGRLLADEVEWIETNHPVLETYERMVLGLVESRGAPMYAGPIIDRIDGGAGWRRESSRVRVVPVATADAARMYGMNLATWRDDRHIREQHTPDAVAALAADLAALADSRGDGEITWGVRQVVWSNTK